MIQNLPNSFFTYLSNLLLQIKEQKKSPKSFAIALSGGSDSLALALLLHQFCKKNKIKLTALIVDHKFRLTSTQETKAVAALCKKFKINCKILTVDRKCSVSNVEASLREMRYQLLYDFCIENKINLLFLGHQQNDVAENFLIRLFRGSSLDGLSPIAEISDFKKIKLIRPLLNYTKLELQNYLQEQQIQWFEDESNDDERFLRNKIRKFFAEFEQGELIQKRIVSSSKEIAELRDLFDETMRQEAAKIAQFHELGYFTLDLKSFCNLNRNLALKFLALILMEVSGNPYKPRKEQLQRLYNEIVVDGNFRVATFYGCVLKICDKDLLIFREKKALNYEITKFDKQQFLFDKRFLIKCRKDQLKNYVFLQQEQLKDVDLQELTGNLDKKTRSQILLVSLFCKKGQGYVLAQPKFYFRTILKT